MNENKLPFLVWLVLIFVLLSYAFRTISIGGYSLRGFAWAIPLYMSIIIIFANIKKITFPIMIWLPWLGLVILFVLLSSDFDIALQRSVMLICPMLVGTAVSSLSINNNTLNTFSKFLLYISFFFFIVALINSISLFIRGAILYGNASGMMVFSLISCFIVVRYVQGESKMLLYWLLLQINPFIQVVRIAIFANLITLPFTLAPLKFRTRIILILLTTVIGIFMFYDSNVQQKMFFSGSGSLQDLSIDNPDFRTSGRLYLWKIILEKADERPWFGYGANASELLVERLTHGAITHPHNDYLRIRYDYGYVGFIIFFICIIMQMVHALKMAKITVGDTQILFYTGATAFIPFIAIMFTDNIILYAAFFGNLHFTILGMAYAAHNTQSQTFEFDDQYPNENSYQNLT